MRVPAYALALEQLFEVLEPIKKNTLVRSWELLPSRLTEEPQSSHVSMLIKRDVLQVLMKLHSHDIRDAILVPSTTPVAREE